MSSEQKDKLICEGEPCSNHPKVYITFPVGSDTVKCGYCGRKFVKNESGNNKTQCMKSDRVKKPD